jgi:hypothetical protein
MHLIKKYFIYINYVYKMLDDITANKYNIILSITLGISVALIVNYFIDKNRIIVIDYPKIKNN